MLKNEKLCNFHAAAPVEILYDHGVANHTVNQTENNGKWVYVGEYYFEEETNGYIKISASSVGYTVADAIKLVPID